MSDVCESAKRVSNNDSGYQNVYEDGWELELLKITGKAQNMTPEIDTITNRNTVIALQVYTSGVVRSYLL